VLGSSKKDDVPGNAKEDDAQDIKDENNSPSSLIVIYHSLLAQQLKQLKTFSALDSYIMYSLPKKPSPTMPWIQR
jgi:hypothetical protein